MCTHTNTREHTGTHAHSGTHTHTCTHKHRHTHSVKIVYKTKVEKIAVGTVGKEEERREAGRQRQGGRGLVPGLTQPPAKSYFPSLLSLQ